MFYSKYSKYFLFTCVNLLTIRVILCILYFLSKERNRNKSSLPYVFHQLLSVLFHNQGSYIYQIKIAAFHFLLSEWVAALW